MHVPFTQLVSEGPYQVGATYERVDYGKREIQLAVMVGTGEPDTIFRYRMIEATLVGDPGPPATTATSASSPAPTAGGSSKSGSPQDPKTMMVLDPQAMDTNFMQWDMNIIAAQPYWC